MRTTPSCSSRARRTHAASWRCCRNDTVSTATLHPEKTRLIEFQRPDRRPPRRGNSDRPGTFDLLGFTHYWGLSRNGKWVVKRKTARDRLSRSLKRVAQWCRLHRHHPIEEQQQTPLAQKLRGH